MPPPEPAGKIRTRGELAGTVRALRRRGKVVGLTNGVFDLIHAGHVAYLAEARRYCDVLVVSLNTDASVRRYKGPTRPLVPLRRRQRVVAALEAVDFVTCHGERHMRKTLETIRPDLYIKGGDYTRDRLTSAGVVEAYGGRVLMLSHSEGVSTTALLERAAEAAFLEGRRLPDPSRPQAPGAFLDRDGVILRPVPFLFEPEKVRLLPGAVEGLKLLREAGYRLVVVTNQGGIGMGYLTHEDFFRVNGRMLSLLHAEGVLLDAVYFCPHSLAFGCACRKPGTALLERAVEEQALRRRGSCLFGDREVDMVTARRFGIPGGLVGPGDTTEARGGASVRGRDLAGTVRAMLARVKRRRR